MGGYTKGKSLVFRVLFFWASILVFFNFFLRGDARHFFFLGGGEGGGGIQSAKGWFSELFWAYISFFPLSKKGDAWHFFGCFYDC